MNAQAAFSASGTIQDFGKRECGCHSSGNSNDPVRVWSPGTDGSVSQSNTADSTATARNSNSAYQDGEQSQSGGASIGIQALAQEAESWQLAGALSGTLQAGPTNDNGPTRVGSPGGGGSVDQRNDAKSTASADNSNRTRQDGSQYQGGSSRCGCGSGPQIQALGQRAGSLQAGFAFSQVHQIAPKNGSGTTTVWSHGNGGMTKQENSAASNGGAGNGDAASQVARQRQ